MTMSQILEDLKKAPPNLTKSTSLTENLERFKGIPKSDCREMREDEFVNFLEQYGWERRNGDGSHHKMHCIFMSITRLFVPPHSNKRKKVLSAGEVAHQSKIFGFIAQDLKKIGRREVRHYAYIERCLFKFPEQGWGIKSYLKSLLENTYLKKDYFPEEYWEFLKLTNSEPSEISLDYLNRFEDQKNQLRQEKISDYLMQHRITTIEPEDWNVTVIKISTSRQIKKDLVEKILIENGFTKPPKLPQILKPKETPKKAVTMETPTKTTSKSKIYLLRKDDKVFAYSHEDLAKVLAQGLGTTVETIEINPESLMEFTQRAMK